MAGARQVSSRCLALRQQMICRRMWISRAARGVSRSLEISYRSDGRQSVDRSQPGRRGLVVQALVDKRCQLERDSLTDG